LRVASEILRQQDTGGTIGVPCKPSTATGADLLSPNSTFEILIINTIMTRSAYSKEVASKPGPDLSISGAIGSVLGFIPGVAAGIMGFIIFGTTSQFRRVYIQTLRRIFCCCCAGRKKNSQNGGADDVERRQTIGGGFSGVGGSDLTGRGGPTYHCRVVSDGTRLEMAASGRIVAVGKDEDVVRVKEAEVRAKEVEAPKAKPIAKAKEDEHLVIARAQKVLQQKSAARLQQPWRTLGIDRQAEREQHWNAFVKDTEV
jgi:hypothetical protein